MYINEKRFKANIYNLLSPQDKHNLNSKLLDRAYKNKSNIAYDKKYDVLAIAGSKSPDDWLHVDPLLLVHGGLQTTQRYKEALAAYDDKLPVVVVGHSLGSSIASNIRDERQKYFDMFDGSTYLYAHPTISRRETRKNVYHFRHYGDPISIFDRASTSTVPHSFNPHAYP
jgi:hypothetical protein